MTILTKIKRLAKAATSGPWEVEEDTAVAQTGQDDWILCECGLQNGENEEANAAYIAACYPEVTLAMLAVIEAAKAMREEAVFTQQKSGVKRLAFDVELAKLERMK